MPEGGEVVVLEAKREGREAPGDLLERGEVVVPEAKREYREVPGAMLVDWLQSGPVWTVAFFGDRLK